MEKLAYRFTNYRDGDSEYSHPTIDIYIEREIQEYSSAKEVISFVGQTDARNKAAYGLHANLDVGWNYNLSTATKILGDISKQDLATFRGVLKYLHSKGAKRYVWHKTGEYNYTPIPVTVRNHPDLYIEAKKSGMDITRRRKSA